MEDNIDNLLDDLDALITNKSPVISSANGFTESFPFRVPHRPPNEKSPTQQNNPNPKNKFAISPSVTHSGSYQTPSFRSENIRSQNSYSSSSSSLSSTSGASSNSSLSKNAGMESIDSLLEMFDEPSKPQPSATFQYSGSSGNRNSNSDSSSFKQLPTQTYSSSHGSSSSSYQPSTSKHRTVSLSTCHDSSLLLNNAVMIVCNRHCLQLACLCRLVINICIVALIRPADEAETRRTELQLEFKLQLYCR